MLYKIKVNPYDGRRKVFKASFEITEEVYKKMLKRKAVQKKFTYSRELAHLQKQQLDLLHACVISAVNKAFKSGISMHGDVYIEVYY